MNAADVVVLVAAVVACTGALVTLVAAGIMVGQVRRLERGIEVLQGETVPLVQEVRRVADHAASEMERVDAVLADTESVTATVDTAARLAQRALANPVVKVLAWRAGAVGGLRRLRDGPAGAGGPVSRPVPALSSELVGAGEAGSGSRRRRRASRRGAHGRPSAGPPAGLASGGRR